MKDLQLLLTCNRLSGLTTAQYLSTDKAVRVNTETPMEMFLDISDTLHTQTPHGHDSTVYRIEVNGTQVKITRRSANAREKMYLKKNRIEKMDLLFNFVLQHAGSVRIV